MPSDLTPEQRTEALATLVRTLLTPTNSSTVCLANKLMADWLKGLFPHAALSPLLEALLAEGWRPEAQPAVQPSGSDGHKLAIYPVEMVSYEQGYEEPAEPVWRVMVDDRCADYDTYAEAVAAYDRLRAPDAISAAEVRGYARGVEAAAEVVDAERKAFRCAGIKDVADVLDFVAAKTRALSSIPPQEADPT